MPTYVMPDPGEGLQEAEIVCWRVNVGDLVAVNDVIVEVETAKSIVELPSPWDGQVAARFGAEGEIVAVGTPLIEIVTEDKGAAHSSATTRATGIPLVEITPVDEGAAPSSPATETGAILVGYGARDLEVRRQIVGPDSEPAAAVPPPPISIATGVPLPQATPLTPATPHDQATPSGRTTLQTLTPHRPAPTARALAKPPVRRLARDAGVNLDTLVGTGPGHTITRFDVLAAAFGEQRPQDERVPLTGLRKGMAHTMTAALDVPHASVWLDVDVTNTVALVESLRHRREFAEVKVSPLLVFSKAVCLALTKYPDLNSSYDPATNELVLKRQINLGIAASTPRGLVVPNIKGADELGLLELAEALNQLVRTARAGGLTPSDTSGGTFTITNVGVFGIDSGTPILNFGETGIACFGAIRPRPWVVADQIMVRQVATIALAFDHRVIDGETGSRFLADVATILHDPAMALLF